MARRVDRLASRSCCFPNKLDRTPLYCTTDGTKIADGWGVLGGPKCSQVMLCLFSRC